MTTTRALILWLLATTMTTVVRGEDIFFEAEAAPEHPFADVAHFDSIISGGAMLRLWQHGDPPAGGYMLSFPFHAAESGTHHFWAGASIPGLTSDFSWAVDGGPWRSITANSVDNWPQRYGVSDAMAWLKLGDAPLEPGAHVLHIRVDRRRTNAEHDYVLYLDAFLITTREVEPRGLTTAADVPHLPPVKPVPAAVARAGQPGAPMMLGTSLEEPIETHLANKIGFTLFQTQDDMLSVNETAPGVWDWSQADEDLAETRRRGVRWQYFPHFTWAPAWYRATPDFVPCSGLRTKRKLALISLWSPHLVPWIDQGFAALANHFGSGDDVIAALYLTIYGDFGETIFPMGFYPEEAKRFGEQGSGTGDYWCDDPYARADFRRFAAERYGTAEKLNAAWGTNFASFDAVDFPPAAYREGVDITSTAEGRRRWLDFVEWYKDSMTRLVGEVCRVARAHFPRTLLEVPIGGGGDPAMFGQDPPGIAKMVAQYGVQIRSTHGGYLPFAEGQAQMIRYISTAAAFYGDPQWLEPPGSVDEQRETSRVFEALTCGVWGFWDWGMNPHEWPGVFQQYTNFFTREKPVTDVALFYPTTSQRLAPSQGFPPRVAGIGAHLRDVMDFDIVDERLVNDGALPRYRVLYWLDGTFIERATLEKLLAWVKAGGVIVHLGAEPPATVEGDEAPGRELLGLQPGAVQLGAEGPLSIDAPDFLHYLAAARSESEAGLVAPKIFASAKVLAKAAGRPAAWAVPLGRGWCVVWADASMGGIPAFCELARDADYHLSRLDAAQRDGLEIDSAWDGVYASRFANGEAIYYNDGNAARTVQPPGAAPLEIPGHAIRSVLLGK